MVYKYLFRYLPARKAADEGPDRNMQRRAGVLCGRTVAPSRSSDENVEPRCLSAPLGNDRRFLVDALVFLSVELCAKDANLIPKREKPTKKKNHPKTASERTVFCHGSQNVPIFGAMVTDIAYCICVCMRGLVS